MLIPRFTLRLLLALTALSGVFSFLVAQAVRGQVWAIALTTALSTLLATTLLHAILFGLAWSMTYAWRLLVRPESTGSPFATSAPPPQVIPPLNQHEAN